MDSLEQGTPTDDRQIFTFLQGYSWTAKSTVYARCLPGLDYPAIMLFRKSQATTTSMPVRCLSPRFRDCFAADEQEGDHYEYMVSAERWSNNGAYSGEVEQPFPANVNTLILNALTSPVSNSSVQIGSTHFSSFSSILPSVTAGERCASAGPGSHLPECCPQARVPLFRWQLTDHDRRVFPVPIIHDLPAGRCAARHSPLPVPSHPGSAALPSLAS